MDGQRGEIGLADAVEEAALPVVVGPPPAGTLYVLPMEDGTEALRQALGAQLEAVALWWERPPPAGPGFVKVAPAQPVTSRHDVECFLETSGIREAEPDVPVVLYVSGHGLTSGAAKHFAVLRETDAQRLLATGLRTTEIVVAALDSHARDVLVIVNMCESADVGGELLELLRSLDTARTTRATLNVLTTAAPKTQVMGGEFALVLRRAHEWLRTAGGVTRPYLTMDEFSRALYQAAQAVGAELGRSLSLDCRPLTGGKLHVPTAALPNPGYRPERAAVEESRQEVAATLEDLGYWLEKASGRTGADDTGWYFSGRKRLNTSVVSFLKGAPGVLVVTGITASGKSAILGRAVTLSDATFRTSALFAAAVGHCPQDTVPDEGAVTIAVTAHNREPLGLLTVIAKKLGAVADPSGRDQLSRWQLGLRRFLGSPGPMVTVVVDALDEATDPAAVVHQVLVPLTGHLSGAAPSSPVRRGVRLVVAVRSSDGADRLAPDGGGGQELLGRLREAFPGAAVLRTDDEDMGKDVEGYVRALLDGEANWAGHGLTEVARTVAEAVGRSFLDARVAAHQLRTEGPRLAADAGWLARLGEGTTGLLKDDLARSAEDGLGADEALALLRATAFAQGRGIAWGEVWPAVASAVHGEALQNADAKIRVLLEGRLAGYLTRDVEEDQRVYRPAHERLAAVLRAWPAGGAASRGGMGMTDGQDEPAEQPDETGGADEACGADEVTGTGATGDAYEDTHRDDHAAVHARIARALADLAAPHTGGRAAGTAPHPYVRRYLARHARLGGVLDDAHVPADVLPWLTGSPIRGLLGPGRGREGRLWLEAWAAVEPYLHRADREDHPSRLASLHLAYTALRHPGLPRPRTPEEAAGPLAVLWSRWTPPVNVLATLDATVRSLTALPAPDGRPALAAGDDDGGIELIDAVEGTAVRERIGAHEGSVRHLLLAPRPAQSPLLVSGSTDGTVRLWDPANGRLVDQVHRPGGMWIADVCAYRDSGHELAVLCVNGDGVVVWWNERMGPLNLLTLPGDTPRTTTTALAAVEGETPGRPLLAIADGAFLAFRDTAAEVEVARFDVPADVRVLAATTRPGTVAAGHADGSVTVWGVGGPLATLTGAGGPVSSLAALTLGERHLLAAGTGSSIAVWDVSRWDTAMKEPPALLSGHTAAVTALSPVASPDSGILASASTDGTLRLWNREVLERALATARTPAEPAATGGALLLPEPGDLCGPSWFALSGGHPHIDVRDIGAGIGAGDEVARIDTGRPVSAMAWARRREGRVLASAGCEDHGIRLWDAGTRQALPDVLEGHFLPVRALAGCATADGRHLLLSGGDDETVRLWDLDRLAPLREWTGHGLRVLAVAAASCEGGGDWFASASSDGTVRLWDAERGGALGGPLRCDQGLLHAVAINPGPLGGLPPHLASGGDTGTVRLWDLRERRPLGEPLTGHTAAVHALALWNAEGHGSFVASGAADGTIRVWDAATGQCRLLLAVGSPVRSLAAHPSAAGGRFVLSFAGDAGAAAVEIDLAECRAGGA
ncbi:WD40 repeat domain-containing protein [Streptomyces sp. NBC_01443]|uniref:WD40 repeat domain-containing protein n=1 Tax=Streptomyces sp. NBC_01443 TaxID=2903868 RepID=UPI00225105A0|nr:WD40 repeat domain-containing protein [Streptomyces sp. NBC_01443]MCX4633320.1 WD40 repeat domain-containing protein [Streptomyces sp. NBC_01443]